MKLHWSNKFALSSLPAAELNLWLALYLHCNGMLRCFPSFSSLQEGLGKSEQTVLRTLHGLEAKRAVIRVPADLRLGQLELSLNKRSNVYQLTGVLFMEGAVKPIVFMKPEDARTIGGELKKLRPQWKDEFWSNWYKSVMTA